MNPKGYVQEIRSIEKEERRLRASSRKLREQKKKAQNHLYQYMESRGLHEYDGITKKKVCPRPKVPRKKVKEKKRDAMELFRQTGIPDPEQFWNEFQKTQKVHNSQPSLS